MREPGKGYASGGTMTGSVFKNIAERVMALNSNRRPYQINLDSIDEENLIPNAKVGFYKAIKMVMTDLKLPLKDFRTDWVKTTVENKHTRIEPIVVTKNVVPDLKGMGAKDAVFILENMGLKVQIFGRGKVISQNIKPGTFARKGNAVSINLE